MFKNLKDHKQGFTMTEVVVASVIFVLAAAGIFATASNLRQPAQESSYDVTAAMIGKEILADLRRNWHYEFIVPDDNPYVLDDLVIDGVTYSRSYNVYDDPSSNARRVVVTVDWNI